MRKTRADNTFNKSFKTQFFYFASNSLPLFWFSVFNNVFVKTIFMFNYWFGNPLKLMKQMLETVVDSGVDSERHRKSSPISL